MKKTIKTGRLLLAEDYNTKIIGYMRHPTRIGKIGISILRGRFVVQLYWDSSKPNNFKTIGPRTRFEVIILSIKFALSIYPVNPFTK